jgi:hypothetical protein
MTKIIIVGADSRRESLTSTLLTPSAGKAILKAAIESPDISHITLLTAHNVYNVHPKVTILPFPSAEYPHGFNRITPQLRERLRGHKALIWAMLPASKQLNYVDRHQ